MEKTDSQKFQKRFINGSEKGNHVYKYDDFIVFGGSSPEFVNKLGGLCPHVPYGSPICIDLCDENEKPKYVNGKNVCSHAKLLAINSTIRVNEIRDIWRLIKYAEKHVKK